MPTDFRPRRSSLCRPAALRRRARPADFTAFGCRFQATFGWAPYVVAIRGAGLAALSALRRAAATAHWYINATAVTAMPRPRTIHDFYGFPPALFEVQYPAPDTEVLVDGYAYGSLSMTAYTLGLPCQSTRGGIGAPQPPAELPPDGSNI